MSNGVTGLVGGLATGVIQDQLLYQSPYSTLKVAPQSNANSATVPALPITQQTIPIWQLNVTPPPNYLYQPIATPGSWCITFPNTLTYLGIPVCKFDCLRNATVTFSTASQVATTVTFDGWDNNGVEVVWTSSSQPIGTTAVVATKCFKILRSVSFSAYPWTTYSAANTGTVRGGTLIGLPNFINSTTSVISAYWGTTNAITNVVVGAVWRQTSPTFTSSDARGYVNITGLGSAPNGSILLQAKYYVYGEDGGVNDQLKLLTPPNYGSSSTVFSFGSDAGSSSAIVQIKNNANGKPTLPSLVTQDRFGAQFPGDNLFMAYYTQLLAV